MASVDPGDARIFAQPGELAAREVVDSEFEALNHLGLTGELAAQQATDKAVFQSKSVQAFVGDPLGQQVAYLLDHALRHALVNAPVDAGVEFCARPIDGQQEGVVEGRGASTLL